MQILQQSESLCIRCGKTRIVSKTWIEKIEKGNPITHSEAVCPDKDCQKAVDDDFAAKRERKLAIINRNATRT